MAERTFIMLKPDTIQRDLIGEIIGRLERRGLKFVAMKLVRMDKKTAEKLYEGHYGKDFFEHLVRYVTSGPVVVAVVESKYCISVVRKMLGATDPKEADAGSIRGDFGLEMRRNVVHASDSVETAEREMLLFFTKEEILNYEKADEEWVYEH